MDFLEVILQVNSKLILRNTWIDACLRVAASVVIILCRVWEARNDVFNGLELNMEVLRTLIENYLCMEYVRLCGESRAKVQPSPMKWEPPPLECLKLTVGFAWKDGIAALTVLARDDLASPVGLWLRNVKTFVEQAKGLAILKAPKVGDTHKYSKVFIESGNKVVVDAILGFGLSHWKISIVVG